MQMKWRQEVPIRTDDTDVMRRQHRCHQIHLVLFHSQRFCSSFLRYLGRKAQPQDAERWPCRRSNCCFRHSQHSHADHPDHHHYSHHHQHLHPHLHPHPKQVPAARQPCRPSAPRPTEHSDLPTRPPQCRSEAWRRIPPSDTARGCAARGRRRCAGRT